MHFFLKNLHKCKNIRIFAGFFEKECEKQKRKT